MTVFAGVYGWKLLAGSAYWRDNGFYLCLAFYGLQRFLWEFIKPYAPVLGPFTLFHFASLVVFFYGLAMLRPAHAPSSGRAR